MVSRKALFAMLLLGFALDLPAQNPPEGRWFDVHFPQDSPVLPVTFSLGPTTVRPRGASMALDLHASLLLRNTGPKTISGLTLRVEAPDPTPAAKVR